MAKFNGPRSQEFKNMLANEYLSTNISIKELSEKYHTDAYYQLKNNGVKLKGRGVQKMISRKGCIKYNWDASTVSNEIQAYTLGFFMADGCNSGKQAKIKLKNSDLDILNKMKNCFSSEIKTQTEGNSCGFVISSFIICKNLTKLGIIENKSRNEKSIPYLSPELLRHFIRGYFDGDGTVFICKSEKSQYLKCNICSSTKNILEQIKLIFIQNHIESTINFEQRIGKTYAINEQKDSVATMNMFRLFIRKKDSIKRLFHYLYDDATIYLSRKYKVFADNQGLLNYIKHVNTELTK